MALRQKNVDNLGEFSSLTLFRNEDKPLTHPMKYSLFAGRFLDLNNERDGSFNLQMWIVFQVHGPFIH